MSTKACHSRAALAQVQAGVDRMRALARRAGGGRAACIGADVALHDLVARQEQLLELHHEIEHAAPADAALLWETFFACYGDFLARLDEAKRDAARAECIAHPLYAGGRAEAQRQGSSRR